VVSAQEAKVDSFEAGRSTLEMINAKARSLPNILTTIHGPETAKQQVDTQKLPRATATSA
jgi:hypothetical protein